MPVRRLACRDCARYVAAPSLASQRYKHLLVLLGRSHLCFYPGLRVLCEVGFSGRGGRRTFEFLCQVAEFHFAGLRLLSYTGWPRE